MSNFKFLGLCKQIFFSPSSTKSGYINLLFPFSKIFLQFQADLKLCKRRINAESIIPHLFDFQNFSNVGFQQLLFAIQRRPRDSIFGSMRGARSCFCLIILLFAERDCHGRFLPTENAMEIYLILP